MYVYNQNVNSNENTINFRDEKAKKKINSLNSYVRIWVESNGKLWKTYINLT